MCDRFELPDMENVKGQCPICNRDIYLHEPTEDCDCGKEGVCDDCTVFCETCGNQNCRECMYFCEALSVYFCDTTDDKELAVGRKSSECMADYLGVKQVIISGKE